MPITTYNTDYYDDYTLNSVSDKNYLKILFKPGYSVQVRELNQMQSMLQDQINRLGNTIYTENQAILGCKVNFTDSVDYADFRLVFDENLTKEAILENVTLITQSGLNARVIGYKDIEEESGEDKIRFYLKYLNTGENNSTKFSEGINFAFELNTDIAPELAGYSLDGEISDADALGFASVITTEKGIFYVNGSFVALPKQTLFVDHIIESEVLVGNIAFQVDEKIITYLEDETLVDNSAGTPNYTAPGADRYQLDLILRYFPTASWENRDNTIQYVKIGEIQNSRLSENIYTNEQQVLYRQIDIKLAQRTEEESGSYTVNPFPIKLTDLYNGQNLPARYMKAGNQYQIESLGIIAPNSNVSLSTEWKNAGVPDDTLVTVGTRFIATSSLTPLILDAIVTEVAHINGMYKWNDLDLIPGYEGYYGIDSDDVDKLDAIEKAKDSFVTTLEPSVAYIDGYRIFLNTSYNIETKKSRTKATFPMASNLGFGNYFIGTMYGTDLPPINNLSRDYELRDGVNGGGNQIGTCRVKSFESIGSKFYLYIYNETVNPGKALSLVKSIKTGNFVFNIDFIGDISTGIQNASNNTLVYPLPYEECDPNTGITNPVVSAYRYYFGATSGTSLTISVGNELNESFDDISSIIAYVGGVRVDTGFEIANSSKSLTISGLTSGQPYTIIAGVTTNTPPTSKRIVITNTTFDASEANNGTFKLTTTDIVEVVSIINSRNGQNIDVTSSFVISDTGVKDTHYTNSKISYIGNGALGGTFTIKYRYFSRVGGGALRYFTANSYANIARQYIPTYNGISLRDTLDFRPDILDGATVNNRLLPNPNSTFRSDAQYYLPRIDKVVANSRNEFTVIEGVPSIAPVEPPTPANCMVLYKLNVPAYTGDVSKILTTYVDNRRYTMRDIAALDKRIKNLEYYTSLSLLERSATEKPLLYDTGDGERTKNGIIVDSFINHTIGDTSAKGYRCSVNSVKGELAPRFNTHNFNLKFSDATVDNSGIKVHKNLITLDYDEEILFSQYVATDDISVQPHLYAQTVGSIELYPSTDDWVDTKTLPERIITDDSAMKLAEQLDELLGITGIDWGEWEATITDTDVINSTTRTQRSGANRRRVTTTTSLVTADELREGFETTLGSNVVNKSLGDRVTNINIIPFMRGRRISFRGSSFKPNTRLYAYFDGIAINEYISPIINDTTFIDATTPLGTDGIRRPTEPRIFNDIAPQDFPSIAQNSTSYAAGFRSYGSELVTNDKGEVWGFFVIPNNDYLKFRTGEKEFKLTSSERNANNADSYGMAKYWAGGLLQEKEGSILSTTVPEFVVTRVSEARTVQYTETTQTFSRWWHDPIAQSFSIDSRRYKEGLFLTSVDIYFSRKGTNSSVALYIVTTENGYPTTKVVPFSRVEKTSDEVNISSNATAATTFTFDNPVYLQADGEYAFIVRSPDPEYFCWTAMLGPNKTDITTGLLYSRQDYLGVFFTSSNASTWTAVQDQDIKFVMRTAKFKSNIGIMKFAGDPPTGVDGVIITNPGSKYTSPPEVVFSAPQVPDYDNLLKPAKGVALIDTITGELSSIKITDPGYGYTSPPTISIDGPPTGGILPVAESSLFSKRFAEIRCSQQTLLFDATSIKNELVVNNQTLTPILLVSDKNVDVPKSLIPNNNIFSVNNPLYVTTTITSSDEYISPVIDITRNSLIAFENIVNSETDLIVDNIDTETTATDGKALARYITQPILLDNAADKVNIFLNINRPTVFSNVLVYIRTLIYNGDDTNIYDNPWTRLYPNNAKKEIPVNSNIGRTSEVEFVYDSDGDSLIEDSSNDFTTFQIKIVLVSDNILEVPTVKDFRAIASI